MAKSGATSAKRAPSTNQAATDRPAQAAAEKPTGEPAPAATPRAAAPASVAPFEPPHDELVQLETETLRLAQLFGVSKEEMAWRVMRAGLKAVQALPAPAELQANPADGMTRVRVTGPKAGRYRAGHHFSAEPRTVDVTADQLAALAADPRLIVAAVGD
jgi:hypothetical protein